MTPGLALCVSEVRMGEGRQGACLYSKGGGGYPPV